MQSAQGPSTGTGTASRRGSTCCSIGSTKSHACDRAPGWSTTSYRPAECAIPARIENRCAPGSYVRGRAASRRSARARCPGATPYHPVGPREARRQWAMGLREGRRPPAAAVARTTPEAYRRARPAGRRPPSATPMGVSDETSSWDRLRAAWRYRVATVPARHSPARPALRRQREEGSRRTLAGTRRRRGPFNCTGRRFRRATIPRFIGFGPPFRLSSTSAGSSWPSVDFCWTLAQARPRPKKSRGSSRRVVRAGRAGPAGTGCRDCDRVISLRRKLERSQ